MSLELFYSRNCRDIIDDIENALTNAYGIEINDYEELEPIYSAYNRRRGQYDAFPLLNFLISRKTDEIALWVIDKDIYCDNMNFIFGYASQGNGAILSIYRLNSTELIRKEAIHEVGHVLGLGHCHNHCVMQFSNSVEEAMKKPSELCEECKRVLNLV
ncbi:MAG: peptidase [Candidatus Altiarchaeales archaeon]|nr:MAG: peptidase [Candidatus Altiarchaeales archaeon]